MTRRHDVDDPQNLSLRHAFALKGPPDRCLARSHALSSAPEPSVVERVVDGSVLEQGTLRMQRARMHRERLLCCCCRCLLLPELHQLCLLLWRAQLSYQRLLGYPLSKMT